MTAAMLAITPTCPAQISGNHPSPTFKVFHYKAEASRVLAALAHLAHANIIVPDDLNTVVNVNFSDFTVDRAVRAVAALSGVAYRKVDNDYIVAPPDRMPQILEQLGHEQRVPLHHITPDAAILQLKQAVPYLTVRPVGHGLTLVGAPEDMEHAVTLLTEIDANVPNDPVETITVTLTSAPSQDVQNLLTSQFPQLKAQKVGEAALVFTGPHSEVIRAREIIRALDNRAPSNARLAVYTIKYTSARALASTLQRTLRQLTVVAGPEPYHIPDVPLNLSTATTLGASGVNGSSTTGYNTPSSLGTSGLSNSGASGLGVQGQAIGGDEGNLQAGYLGSDRARTLILGGTDENVSAALKLLETIDIPTPQVVLDVKVVSASPQTTANLGIDWSNSGQGQNASLNTTLTERGNVVSPTDQPNVNSLRQPLGLGSFGRVPLQLSAALNAFFRREDVRILAKPTITALDDETGEVYVGETRRVSVSSVLNNAGTNNVVLNNVVEIPVGIILQMRPRVNSDHEVTLHVHPIYSSGGATDSNTGLFSTFQREADTQVRVTDGETLVIGGLLQDEDTKTLIKVPILGDLPLVGQLFRNHTHSHLRREVMVFVTPHILKN